MIVDCHTHISPGADDIARSEHLEASETVDACIVLATADGPSEEVNAELSEYVNKHEEKMIGFGLVGPHEDKASAKTATTVVEKLGLKGAVLYCCHYGFHPAHSQAMRFYESAQELGLPVFFHNGGPELSAEAVLEYAQPYLLDEVARGFPGLKIIIGRMGMPFVEQTLSMVAKHANVYADLTVMPSNVWRLYNIVMTAHEQGVMDKLLFGSGYPLGTAGQCMETLLSLHQVLADTSLPTVPRGNIQSIIERDTLEVLGIKSQIRSAQGHKSKRSEEHKSISAEEVESSKA